MLKQAFLVLGPESCGNRYVTQCFVQSGCAGQFGHIQSFDESFEAATDRIVWRRSLPYGDNWPDLDAMLRRLRAHHFLDVRVVALLRNGLCAIQSQAREHHRPPGVASRNILIATRMISSFILENNLPHVYVTYESLAYPELLRTIFAQWGLDSANIVPFEDKNRRYLQPPGN
jgi:hypothetical protein